ncbi:nucleotidyltransferase domain-containing protein [Candidatus Micrarchaeota archaeon]|nr:nucleotidyltransferase domain-containing protein [Candidatus Micrarchaeota archaeon]
MRINDESIAKQVFGSKLKRKILHFLLQEQESLSERELARVLGVSHTAVNKAMRQLLDLNVIKGKTVGNALVWKLNTDSFAYPYVKAFLEASEITPLNSIKRITKETIEFLNIMIEIYGKNKIPPIKAAYIFGSVAEGTARPESDIDILVIVEREGENKMLKLFIESILGMAIQEKMGNRASIHIYDEKAVEKNKPDWLSEATNKGIKVYG